MKLVLLLLCTLSAFSSPLDDKIKHYVDQFNLRPLKAPTGFNRAKYELGKKLFFEKSVSGNKDVSCSTCHDPSLGTSDGLPLPIGVGAKGIGPNRVANGAPTIPRNAPHLFNLHNDKFMFWDGRVKFDGDVFTTPEEGLNGDYPEYQEITKNLQNALAAQALFPPTSHAEMRGQNNELANAKSNIEVWSLIMKRLLSINEYRKLFKRAFPNDNEFNIGHFGHALSHFQTHEFAVFNTPWDRYLRGEKFALSTSQKRGVLVFIESGRCINCHSGSEFGSDTFQNIISPQIGPGKDIKKNDEGRFMVTGHDRDRYKFKTPALRNIAKTAPFLHSGAYETLEEVIDHYNRGPKAIDEYSDRWLTKFEINNYGKSLFVERNPYMLFRKKENAHPLMRNHMIRMTNPQKRDLLNFIKYGLTQ